MTRNNSRFARGSAVYSCRVCGIKTRETGSCESGCELCVDCFELAGMDNHCNDNGVSPADAGYVAERDRRLTNIIKKGGNAIAVKKLNSFLFDS